MLVSRGDLPNALGTTATMGFSGLLTYAWTDNSGINFAKANDQAVLLAYCPDFKQAIYTTAVGRWDILYRSDLRLGETRCKPTLPLLRKPAKTIPTASTQVATW